MYKIRPWGFPLFIGNSETRWGVCRQCQRKQEHLPWWELVTVFHPIISEKKLKRSDLPCIEVGQATRNNTVIFKTTTNKSNMNSYELNMKHCVHQFSHALFYYYCIWEWLLVLTQNPQWALCCSLLCHKCDKNPACRLIWWFQCINLCCSYLWIFRKCLFKIPMLPLMMPFQNWKSSSQLLLAYCNAPLWTVAQWLLGILLVLA